MSEYEEQLQSEPLTEETNEAAEAECLDDAAAALEEPAATNPSAEASEEIEMKATEPSEPEAAGNDAAPEEEPSVQLTEPAEPMTEAGETEPIEQSEPELNPEEENRMPAEAELGEEMVEQLSLLDGELPHLEAANAPSARKAKAVLEGLLFVVGDEGITAEQAATALDITPELAAEYFDDLMKDYTNDDRGIEIASYGGVYRFLSKAFVHEYAKRLFQISKQNVLSQAALETLAIIAYKQPITRVEIEEIRGVGADMMLRKLLARDLIKESGRSEAAGRPILYEVTEEFMNSFKLLSLKELPELPQFNTEEESEELFNQ